MLEEKGYKKWEIEQLDDWYIYHILYYPRQEKSDVPIIKPKRKAIKQNSEDTFRKRLFQIGCPIWYIELRIKQMRDAQLRMEQKEKEKKEKEVSKKEKPSASKAKAMDDPAKSITIIKKKDPKKKKR